MSDTQKSSQKCAIKWIYSAQEAIDKCNELERENAELKEQNIELGTQLAHQQNMIRGISKELLIQMLIDAYNQGAADGYIAGEAVTEEDLISCAYEIIETYEKKGEIKC